jgi:hypothetical protein
MKKELVIIILILFFTINYCTDDEIKNEYDVEIREAQEYIKSLVKNINENNYLPSDGVVKDEDTASKIATIILNNIYGENNIQNQKPFKVILFEGIWIIMGTLPKDTLGGVVKIMIQKEDGKVLYIDHTQ